MNELEKLRRENEDLRRSNAMKSDWISISAHELRTTLSAIKWILKMFLDKDFGGITMEQEGFMKKAFDSTERMLGIVSEMLSINHAEDGSFAYSFAPTDISELIDGVIFDFRGESFKKGIEIIFLRPSPLPPPINMDASKIRVVLQNLMENAIKYSEKGEAIIISVKDTPDVMTVSVKDNGIGIPAAEQGRIFEKFFRAKNAEEKDPVGSGFGLYTTKKIVEGHSGKMWFDSAEGEGTTFFFSIPRNLAAK